MVKENNIGHGQSMEREIVFRQFCDIEDDVDYGVHYFNLQENKIVKDGGWSFPQQRTGLTDKNGLRIFEGDILENNIGDFIHRFLIIFGEGCYIGNYLGNGSGSNKTLRDIHKTYSIIGNIYNDNHLINNETKKTREINIQK